METFSTKISIGGVGGLNTRVMSGGSCYLLGAQSVITKILTIGYDWHQNQEAKLKIVGGAMG